MKLTVREGFREQKPKGSEKARFDDTSRKRILCSMNSKYKAFEGKACSRNGQEAVWL